jgi:prephenate dehydrogenase
MDTAARPPIGIEAAVSIGIEAEVSIGIESEVSIGIIGFGAFGRLIAQHLHPYARLIAYDLAPAPGDWHGATPGSLEEAAACSIVILAVPVSTLQATVEAIGPLLHPGTLVLDVGSVKVIPADIMRRCLPGHVDIVATHPLFGPQSARNGIEGLKIAICPIRGKRVWRIAAFARRVLGLQVILTTPEAHDQEAAMVQGLTHLIAKVLVQMEPLPTRMTTRSFELLMQGVDMVRNDAPEVFQAIEGSNPYSRQVRRRFFDLASTLDAQLEHGLAGLTPALPASRAVDSAPACHDGHPSMPLSKTR